MGNQMTESDIQKIKDEIVSAHSKSDEVGLNNTVTVYFEDDEETDTFCLVTSIRGNSLEGKISIESPMGKALLGYKVRTCLCKNERTYRLLYCHKSN